MTQYAQAVRGALYEDITVKNTGLTALTAGYVVKVDATTYASAPDPLPVSAIATSDDDAVAYAVIVDNSIPAGGTGRACRFGSVVAIAGTGGVTINDLLILDSATGHEGTVKTLPDAVAHVGKSLGVADHTAAAGEPVRIHFQPHAATTA